MTTTFVSIAPARDERGTGPPAPGARRVRVVGVVIHRDEDRHLEQSVRSLAVQTRSLDAIVVAHVGADPAPAWISERVPGVRVVAASGPASTAGIVEEIVRLTPADAILLQAASDWSAPTRLETMLAIAELEHASLVGSDYLIVAPELPDAHSQAMPADGNAAFETGTGGSVVEPWTMLIDRQLIDRLGGFNTGLTVAAGNEFAARAAVVSRVVNVPRVLYFRRGRRAGDWSSSGPDQTLSERVVFGALAERSRAYALSIARRAQPDVHIEPRRPPIALLHVAGPPIADPIEPTAATPSAVAEAGRASDRARRVRDTNDTSPVFVTSGFESVARFVACAIGQHPNLKTVNVSTWMSEVAQLAARFLVRQRAEGSTSPGRPADPDSTYAAAAIAVDALFSGGGSRSPERWVGAIPGDRTTLAAATVLYPDAHFVHVVRPVDEAVAAEQRAREDADVEELYASWLTATHAVLDTGQVVDPSRWHTVSYTELRDRPARIGRCLELIGEDDDAACAAFLNPGETVADPVPAIVELGGVPAQLEARRLSFAMCSQPSHVRTDRRPDSMIRVLTDGSTELTRRRRATDIVADDRNPYVRSHDLVRRATNRGANVCVVSKGDEMAVRIRGHSLGWHFPQTADGTYVGYHPKDSREAIAHLEHLRDRGAEYFLIPEIYMWWLKHYRELRQHLDSSYRRIPSEDGEGALWDLRPIAPETTASAVVPA